MAGRWSSRPTRTASATGCWIWRRSQRPRPRSPRPRPAACRRSIVMTIEDVTLLYRDGATGEQQHPRHQAKFTAEDAPGTRHQDRRSTALERPAARACRHDRRAATIHRRTACRSTSRASSGEVALDLRGRIGDPDHLFRPVAGHHERRPVAARPWVTSSASRCPNPKPYSLDDPRDRRRWQVHHRRTPVAKVGGSDAAGNIAARYGGEVTM